MSRIRNLIRRIRRDGLRATLEGLFLAIRPSFFGIYRFEGFPDVLPVFPAEVEAVQTDLASLRLARGADQGLPDQFYYDLTRNYQACLFVILEGNLAAIQWILRGPDGSRDMELGEQDAELGGLYVLAEFRGRGLAKALVWQGCLQLQRQGVKNIFATIEGTNVASQRAFRALGFRRIAQLRRPPLFGPRYLAGRGRVESWGHAVARGLGLRIG